ncbi:MAG: hypothetical protein E7349_07610 [Clostridiales bacterium]|nr:hypothetical protein [Clostridiales bacterium]
MKNDEFVQDVLEMDKNASYVKICNAGKANGKLIYVAKTMGCDGFFAELRFVLHEIYYADKYGFIPVATMSESSCYAEAYPVNGSKNPFEYYFKPTSNIAYQEAEMEYAYVRHTWVQRKQIELDTGMVENNYKITDRYMETMSNIVKKYLRYNDAVQAYLDENTQMLAGKKILGVHVRGADFKRGYKNHPFIVTTDEYIAQAKEDFEQGNYDGVFLATDDQEALEKFSEMFADKLYYYKDVIRTDGDETVMKSESDRDNHHYKLGLEVIRDMHTLSCCSGLIAGMSNVSIFARILKKSRGEEYQTLTIIDKGIKK